MYVRQLMHDSNWTKCSEFIDNIWWETTVIFYRDYDQVIGIFPRWSHICDEIYPALVQVWPWLERINSLHMPLAYHLLITTQFLGYYGTHPLIRGPLLGTCCHIKHTFTFTLCLEPYKNMHCEEQNEKCYKSSCVIMLLRANLHFGMWKSTRPQ